MRKVKVSYWEVPLNFPSFRVHLHSYVNLLIHSWIWYLYHCLWSSYQSEITNLRILKLFMYICLASLSFTLIGFFTRLGIVSLQFRTDGPPWCKLVTGRGGTENWKLKTLYRIPPFTLRSLTQTVAIHQDSHPSQTILIWVGLYSSVNPSIFKLKTEIRTIRRKLVGPSMCIHYTRVVVRITCIWTHMHANRILQQLITYT